MRTTFLNRLFIFLAMMMFAMSTFAQGSSTLTGTLTDKEGGDPLPFASIIIKGTTIGATTDINGKYTLTGVPIGNQTIEFNYLGYTLVSRQFKAEGGKTVVMNVAMSAEAIMGKEVLITAQAKGQTQAINQQLNAPGIVNVISIEKLRELPDVNAADAIGRLPGIMVQRSGGEGEKVIIRGLDPKYSAVAINGVSAPSSSATDRSTNLNLISPEIISGIEVLKANTADKDADGMGGTVNMIVKEADRERKLNVVAQTGYSGQIRQLSNFKGAIFYNDRFFNQKLGMMISGNAERYDRSSDQLKVGYDVVGNPGPNEIFRKPQISNQKLQSNLETRDRYNASAIFDFRLGEKSTIKMVNMYSRTERDQYVRSKTFSMSNNQLRYEQTDRQLNEWMLSNSIDGKHTVGKGEITWGVSRAHTEQYSPYGHSMNFRHPSGFKTGIADLMYYNPLEVPNPENLSENVKTYFLYDATQLKTKIPETEWSVWGDYKLPFSLSKAINGYIKVGAKARIKDRSRSTERWSRRFDNVSLSRDSVYNSADFEKTSGGYIGITSLLDPNFKTDNFLNGISDHFQMDYAIDRNSAQNWLTNNQRLYRNTPTAAIKDDYRGHEELYAGYVMGEFNFGKMVTFIPGVRIDHSNVRYTAYMANEIPDDYESDVPDITAIEQTASYQQTYFLPQIHLKVKPLSWFDVRLAYTQTLSRPDYDYMAPRTQITTNSQKVSYSSPVLNSSKSENFDFILSFYQAKFGLLTLGAFRKNIDDFIYMRSAIMNKGTDVDPSKFGLPDDMAGYRISYPRNNPSRSTITGFEIEAQTNFRYLPKPFNGFVISGNVTFMNSESKYQSTLFVRNPNWGEPNEPRFINKDTAYVDRLLKQPAFLANASIGYDIRGFSARISVSHQADILTTPQTRPDKADKESSLSFTRWDFQMKQKIGKRVSLLFNLTNIFNCPDRAIRDVTGYYTSVEYYGMGANLGIKVDIF